jgi:hypothetical protein
MSSAALSRSSNCPRRTAQANAAMAMPSRSSEIGISTKQDVHGVTDVRARRSELSVTPSDDPGHAQLPRNQGGSSPAPGNADRDDIVGQRPGKVLPQDAPGSFAPE